MNTRLIQHDTRHVDIEQLFPTDTGEYIWAVVACNQKEDKMTAKYHDELDAFEARIRAEQAERELADLTQTEYVFPATKSQLLALRELCIQNNTPEYTSAALALDNAIELLTIAAHADEAHNVLEQERDIESLR